MAFALLSSAVSGRATTAILMMDTRDPSEMPTLLGDASFSMRKHMNVTTFFLTHYLNLRYARAHGYDLLFFRMVGRQCQHARWGARHPSYCKLSAVAEALSRGYEWVAAIDSDAFVRNTSLPLPALLRAYGGEPAAAGPDVFFGWDSPYTLGPNAGIFVVRNSAAARELLRVWWSLYPGEFGVEHPFEQRALQWQLAHLHRFRRRVQTLALRTMDPTYPDAIVHLDHNAGTKTRTWMGARAAAKLLPHRDHPSISREQRSLLRLSDTKLHRRKLPRRTRNAVVEAVVRAAAADLSAQGGGGAPAFDATAAAARHLRLTEAEAAAVDGLPLQLHNCTSAPSPLAQWQAWELSTAADGDGGAQRLRLRARRSLCLSVGETRAARPPYVPLAALAACDADDGGGDDGARGARSSLMHSAESGLLRTTREQRSLRRLLPELRPGCGFWPNCTGTRFVLPKLCWAELPSDLHACGEEEGQVVALIERAAKVRMNSGDYLADVKPGWRRAAIGAGGPVAEASLGQYAADALCLSVWRGKLGPPQPGAPAVFGVCPRSQKRNARAAAKAERAAKRLAKKGGKQDKWTAQIALDSTPHKARWQAGDENAGWDLREREGGGVHVVPRSAPGLCLTAPPLLPTE